MLAGMGGEMECLSRPYSSTRVWTKKSEKRISKIIWGVKQRGKHFGKKLGLADIRKPDDDLGNK